MIVERLYTIGEPVMYAMGGIDAEEFWKDATVIENAMPDATEIEIHIEDEPEPRTVLAVHVVRHSDRFISSG